MGVWDDSESRWGVERNMKRKCLNWTELKKKRFEERKEELKKKGKNNATPSDSFQDARK